MGSYFFKSNIKQVYTLNGEHYRLIIIKFFWPVWNDPDTIVMWCAMTSLDVFLWGFLKSQLYGNTLQITMAFYLCGQSIGKLVISKILLPDKASKKNKKNFNHICYTRSLIFKFKKDYEKTQNVTLLLPVLSFNWSSCL